MNKQKKKIGYILTKLNASRMRAEPLNTPKKCKKRK